MSANILSSVFCAGFNDWKGFCYPPAVWSRGYLFALLAVLLAFAVATSILFARVKSRGKVMRVFRRVTRTPAHHDKDSGQRRKTTTAVVVLAAAASRPQRPSPSPSSSSPFEQHGSSLLSLLVLFATTAPTPLLCLARPAAAHAQSAEVELRALISEAEEDLLLCSCYLLVLLGAAVVPVVHLLCDDVISGVGADLFRCRFRFSWRHPTGTNAVPEGLENEAFSSDLTEDL